MQAYGEISLYFSQYLLPLSALFLCILAYTWKSAIQGIMPYASNQTMLKLMLYSSTTYSLFHGIHSFLRKCHATVADKRRPVRCFRGWILAFAAFIGFYLFGCANKQARKVRKDTGLGLKEINSGDIGAIGYMIMILAIYGIWKHRSNTQR